MDQTSATPNYIDHTRRAGHLRAYLELFFRGIEPFNLWNFDVTLDSLSPRLPYRYVAPIYDGKRHWLEFDDDLGQLVLTLAQSVVAEVPWSPEEVLDLDTGQRFPAEISVSVWLPEERTLLVHGVFADFFVNRQ